MKLFFTFVIMIVCGLSVIAADEEPEAAGEDSSAGLPEGYAKDYLIAASTISPDKKFAVIYPTLDEEEAAENANHPEGIKNYVVALQPFTVLGELQTKYPYFQNQSNGGISADWSDDSSVALITLDGKWGPHDVFLLEFRDGKLARTRVFSPRRTIFYCQTTASQRPNRTTTFSISFLTERTARCSNSTARIA